MGRIRILPDSIANKIAAGEVVERPASIVKELVENAIDAGGARLRVDVEAGGKRFIRVTDDGSGMNRDDALLAFERHATSKLRQAEDLLSIATLGFRGEALPSIAAVSRLVLETREAGDPAGTRIEIHGGRLLDVKDAGVPAGTSVTARDLFYNLPARRKFLRSEQTEMARVAEIVTHYALAHPERGFTLTTPTGTLLEVAPVAGMRERFFQVFGGQALEQMVDLGRATMEVGPGLVYALSGFLSTPQVQKGNRSSIFVFVNRRLIRDRLILHALAEAYRNVIPPGAFPMALLFLEMPFEEVDVNVHPSKTEVRFRQQNAVHDFVRDAIRRRLSESRPVSTFPVTAPPEITRPAPVLPELVLRSQERPAEPIKLKLDAPVWAEPPRIPQPAYPSPQPSAPGGEEPVESRLPQWSALRPLGQIRRSFIVAEGEDGLWIIDQHVAHERVLFEQVLGRRERQERLESQQLLMPYILRLTPAQQAAFEELRAELEGCGFEIEPFGHSTVAIKAAPAGVGSGELEKVLNEVLDKRDGAPPANLEEVQRKVAASVACHAAIKVNMPLDQRKMEWLLDALSRTESPMTCPHGRPVVLRYAIKDILKAFHRI
jgi:DNA mismatch repair protein MutL